MDPEQSPNLAYGIHAVEEILKQRVQDVERVYFSSEISSAPLFNLMKLCRKERLSYQHVPSQRLDSLAATTKHQGIVAVCSAKAYDSVESLLERLNAKKTSPLLYIPASIEDPRNLGSLIRSSVAFGVDAILLERKNTALLGATVAKASAGMLEHCMMVKPRNLEGLLLDLKGSGYRIIGAHQEKPTRPQELDLTGPLIIITGGEHRGIPPYLAKLCTDFTGIPIAATVQSLNVSVAGSILLYECSRQRGYNYRQS